MFRLCGDRRGERWWKVSSSGCGPTMLKPLCVRTECRLEAPVSFGVMVLNSSPYSGIRTRLQIQTRSFESLPHLSALQVRLNLG